jgi:hypothetical protein
MATPCNAMRRDHDLSGNRLHCDSVSKPIRENAMDQTRLVHESLISLIITYLCDEFESGHRHGEHWSLLTDHVLYQLF